MEACLFYMLAVLHFTNNSSHSVTLTSMREVPFQSIKHSDGKIFAQIVGISVASSKLREH